MGRDRIMSMKWLFPIHQHPPHSWPFCPGTFPESTPSPTHPTIHSSPYPTLTIYSYPQLLLLQLPTFPPGQRYGHGHPYSPPPMLTCSWATLNRISFAPTHPAYGWGLSITYSYSGPMGLNSLIIAIPSISPVTLPLPHHLSGHICLHQPQSVPQLSPC